MTLQGALALLQQLTEKFPPDKGAQHDLRLNDGKLCLHLFQHELVYLYLLDEDDVAAPGYVLLGKLCDLHIAQLAVGTRGTVENI